MVPGPIGIRSMCRSGRVLCVRGTVRKQIQGGYSGSGLGTGPSIGLMSRVAFRDLLEGVVRCKDVAYGALRCHLKLTLAVRFLPRLYSFSIACWCG